MTRLCAALAFLLFATGARAQDAATANDLKVIGIAYHNHISATNAAPAKAEDLAPYFENDKRLLDLLKTGRIAFIYGVGIEDMKDGTANTIVAYPKEAAKKGGFCLYGDGSVRKLSAEDFEKAIKAKPKQQ